MESLIRKYFALGSTALLLGGTGVVWGTRAMARIVMAPPPQTPAATDALARDLIAPHIAAFIGLGIALYGAILLFKGFLFHADHKRRTRRSIQA